MLFSDAAFAYRPFDGTDAAVAEPGEMEIEFQPAGLFRQQWSKLLSRHYCFISAVKLSV